MRVISQDSSCFQDFVFDKSLFPSKFKKLSANKGK